jgi:predicted membrane protein
MISYSTGEPAGNLEAGAVATLTGSVRIAVVSGGVLSLAGAAIVAVLLPAMWRYDARTLTPPAADPAQSESTAAEIP